jgi:hypothetical protein
METWVVVGYHPRRGGCYDSREDRSPTPEPPGTCVFSREIRTASFPQRFCQPTSIDKYTGETDPRVWLDDYRLACQLGGATTDEVIIRNQPLHLSDSARTWLEHLPACQIHNWVTWSASSREASRHVRAPWELLGSARMHPEIGRVAPGLHTALL